MMSRQKSNFNVFLTVLLLLSMTIYNSQITYLRLFFVLYFFFVPIIYIWFHRSAIKAPYQFRVILFFSIIFSLYILFSFFRNFDTFTLTLSGPMVELLTPLLILSAPFIFIFLTHQSSDVLNKSIFIFIYLLLFVLILDVILRYFINPDCFMNYSCRKEAKIIGLFSTTNVIGTFLLYIIFSLKRKHFSFPKKLFLIILFTAMSRAAIVTFFLISVLKTIVRVSFFLKFNIFVILVLSAFIVYQYNPLGLINDGSLLSKFDFISSALSTLETSEIQNILFGFGASFESVTKVVGVDGYSPHSPFLKAYFYFGLTGLFFYFLLNLYFLIIDMRFFFFVILSSFINGIAGAPIYNPTIWVAFAIFLSYKKGLKHA